MLLESSLKALRKWKRFHKPFDERQRRAEFVADMGHKLVAGVFQLLEPAQGRQIHKLGPGP